MRYRDPGGFRSYSIEGKPVTEDEFKDYLRAHPKGIAVMPHRWPQLSKHAFDPGPLIGGILKLVDGEIVEEF